MSLSTQIRLRTWRPLRKLTDHMRYFSSRSVGHHFKLYSVMLSKSEWRDSATGKTSLRWLCGCKNRHPSISYAKHSNEVEKTADLERIREMQKYFEQYTEEYVETEAEPEMLSGTSKTDSLRRRLEPLLNFHRDSAGQFSVQEVVNILREERAEDIVCIKVPICDAPDKYIVICTPHNMRHGEAMVLAIRKCFKLKTDCRVEPPKKAKVGRWLCYNLENIALHMMSRDARLKYDLESLWGVGWEETLEDELDIPPPSVT